MSGGESPEQRLLEALQQKFKGQLCAANILELAQKLGVKRMFKKAGVKKALRTLFDRGSIRVEKGPGHRICVKVPLEDEFETVEAQSDTKE